MTYERINFVDQSVERPRTYEMTHNADGSITLTDSFGLVNELGTPINADTMNHLEDGIDSKQDQLIAGDNIILENNVISAKSGAMPIGTIVPVNASTNYVPDGLLPCDGAEYTQAQFNDLWSNYLTGGLLNICTYSEYEADITTYGQCSKFAVDVDNEKFRVPLIKDRAVIQQALSDSELGKSYNANILIPNTSWTGNGVKPSNSNAGEANSLIVASGVVEKTETLESLNYTDSQIANITDFTNNAVAFRYFVVVANGQTNQSMMDWSAWASSLQGKANTDLSNVPQSVLGLRKLVEVSDSSLMPSWYKVFKEIQVDGSVKKWCEQGSVITPSSTGKKAYNYAKPFADENYLLFKQYLRNTTATDGASQRLMAIYKVDATSYSNYDVADSSYSWQAMGYIN